MGSEEISAVIAFYIRSSDWVSCLGNPVKEMITGGFIQNIYYSRVTSFPLFFPGLGTAQMVFDPLRGEPVEFV
jgi:hypothetical protein